MDRTVGISIPGGCVAVARIQHYDVFPWLAANFREIAPDVNRRIIGYHGCDVAVGDPGVLVGHRRKRRRSG